MKADPGCTAKTNLLAAGVATDSLDENVYLRAIVFRQFEGSFGPPVDTAAMLRGHAAFGLLNRRSREAFNAIAELLVDARQDGSITDARRAAIHALATAPGETSVALLRLTARTFSTDPETLGEIFTALNALEPARSFDFIAGHLTNADSDIADLAALAMAESKQPCAVDVLLATARSFLSRCSSRGLYTALGLTRAPAAIEFLLDRFANASREQSTAADEALAMFRHDAAIAERLEAIRAMKRSTRPTDAGPRI